MERSPHLPLISSWLGMVKHTLHREEQGRRASSPTVELPQLKEAFLHPPAGSAGQGLRLFPLFINIQELTTAGTGVCVLMFVLPSACTWF